MKQYVVCVQSLGIRTNVRKWVRGIEAKSLPEACRIAVEREKNLGLTPTTVSTAWAVWPQVTQSARK